MNWWCANRTATTPTTTLLKTAASASPWIGRVRLTARWNAFLPSIHLSNCNVLIPSRFSIADQQISLTLQRSFIDAFDDFSKDLLNACSYEPGAGSLPVSVIIIPSSWKKKSKTATNEFIWMEWISLTFYSVLGSRLRKEKPVFHRIHGSGHHSDVIPTYCELAFLKFIAILIFYFAFHLHRMIFFRIVYFIAVALTAAVFINERKQGLLDRSLVAGVTTTEIMIAHLVNQFTVLMGQTALVFVFMILVFQIPCIGSLTLAIFITLLQGMCGMSYGMSSSLPVAHAALSNTFTTLSQVTK